MRGLCKRPMPHAIPTPCPWSIEDGCIMYQHWQYTGWPHFGRITVARLDCCWPQGLEQRANLELIATAVNSCFAIAPVSPIAAAKAYPALVNAVTDFLEHGEDPNFPLRELTARLREALCSATQKEEGKARRRSPG